MRRQSGNSSDTASAALGAEATLKEEPAIVSRRDADEKDHNEATEQPSEQRSAEAAVDGALESRDAKKGRGSRDPRERWPVWVR